MSYIWTPEEDASVAFMKQAGLSYQEMADRLPGRTAQGIITRCRSIGKHEPHVRVTVLGVPEIRDFIIARLHLGIFPKSIATEVKQKFKRKISGDTIRNYRTRIGLGQTKAEVAAEPKPPKDYVMLGDYKIRKVSRDIAVDGAFQQGIRFVRVSLADVGMGA